MKKIQIISDIYLDSFDKNVDINYFLNFIGDYLLILGNLGYPNLNNYENFLKKCSESYKLVFIVSGNHEYHCGLNFEETDELIENICKKFNNVFYLNNKIYETEDTIFIGTTLWYKLKVENYNNLVFKIKDFENIKDGDKRETYKYILNKFEENVNWLEKILRNIELNNDKRKVVILSHHIPSYKCLNQDNINILNKNEYTSELDYLFSHFNINYWIFGHLHQTKELNIKNTILLCNSRGIDYNMLPENKFFDRNKYIELY